MLGAEVLTALVLLLFALGLVETWRHRRVLRRIPVRIHVNGTRGKSSVVRLIAAGLRAGGKVTCAKTTGTLARMILPDGRELPVFRPARANVIEQIRIAAAAADAGAEVLVVECMALQPSLQWLSEARLVRATHGVITNARPDHLDVMGPGPDDVARALAGMIPAKGRFYTAEVERLGLLAQAAEDREAELVTIGAEEVGQIAEAELTGFSYREHPDNLALALRVCTDLGVPRAVALAGMQAATPDPGAMTEHEVRFFGRRLYFINGFAANDPQSTEQIWRMAVARHGDVDTCIALFNCRADRADRSRQLGESCASWPRLEHLVLMGSGGYNFARPAIAAGVPAERITFAENQPVDELFETLVSQCGPTALIMGMGNIGGAGLDVVRFFKNREAHVPRRRTTRTEGDC